MKLIYRTIIFLLIASLAACVSTQSNMTAANDEDQDIGLGGTGMLASSGSGLGGTGVVGLVTGFGSIFVNGIEIEYNKKTPFSVDGKTSAHQPIEVGDIVEVLTANADTHTNAQSINLRHEVIGEVESVNRKAASFTVQGQTILHAENMSLPNIGNSVAVAGFRVNEKTIKATRVTPANGQARLLRKGIELPFKESASRWLVQTHVKNSKATFLINNSTQVVELGKQAIVPLSGLSQIKILQLSISNTGKIEFIHEVDSLNIPRGSRTPLPAVRSDSHMMKKSMQIPTQMKIQPVMPRFGR